MPRKPPSPPADPADKKAAPSKENLDHCRRCETLAVAYQVVVASPGRTRLSEVGRVGLQYVEVRLRGLARSGKPLPEIRREADRLMRIVQEIVTEELDARPVIRERERWDRD